MVGDCCWLLLRMWSSSWLPGPGSGLLLWVVALCYLLAVCLWSKRPGYLKPTCSCAHLSQPNPTTNTATPYKTNQN